MNLKSQTTSIRQKLAHLAKQRNTSTQNITTVFLIERLLAKICSDKSQYSCLVFKGGYVGLRIYQSNRYTIDLDALLVHANLFETIDKIKIAAQTDLNDATWFVFENNIDLKTQGEYGGKRLEFRAGIGAPLKDLR